MTATLAPAADVDRDPHRPGIQLLVDLWLVTTTEGTSLLAAPTGDLAERWAVHTLVSSGHPAPQIRGVRLATAHDVATFQDDIRYLLGIDPGPIPPDLLSEATRKLSALPLATYRLLTERDPGEATPLPRAQAPTLEMPERFRRIDWPRMRLMGRNLTWFAVWLTVALLPILAASLYLAGHVEGWWTMAGWDHARSVIDQRAVIVRAVLTPVAASQFLWGLAVFVASHRQLFARFQLWPDTGGQWDRDL